MKHSVLNSVRLFRRDMGNMLIHFTRGRTAGVIPPYWNGGTPWLPPSPEVTAAKTAFEVLREILQRGKIFGSGFLNKGGYKCVSFTEWPVAELPALFALNDELAKVSEQPRYEPYGIAVRKEWLFQRNGRPVIYSPDSEYSLLPPELQWRYVRYEPPYIDFSWEREWRVPCAELTINPSDVIVLVKEVKEAHWVTYGFSQLSPGLDPKTGANVTYSNPSWMAVSLDLFGG